METCPVKKNFMIIPRFGREGNFYRRLIQRKSHLVAGQFEKLLSPTEITQSLNLTYAEHLLCVRRDYLGNMPEVSERSRDFEG
jgi:hypothetical protein